MRVLVTGCGGHVGSALSQRLAEGGHVVTGLDLREGPGVTVVGSVDDAAAVGRAMRGIEAVIHVAGLHVPDVARRPPEDFWRVNVEGTRLLLEAAAANRVGRFVYTSTTSVYGHALEPRGEAVWVTEDLPPQPRDIYDQTKLAAEALLRSAAEGGAVACACIRMGRCFAEAPDVMAVHRLGRGVDVRDVAQAHLLALERPEAGGDAGFAIYNVAAKSPFVREDCPELWRDAASVIRRRVPWAEAAFARRGWRLPDRIDRVYVTEKAERKLGYRARFNLAEFIRE